MDFPTLGGLYVADGALMEINVETQEVKVIHCFKLDGVAEKVVVDECLDGGVRKEVFVVDNETVVHISVVCEV